MFHRVFRDGRITLGIASPIRAGEEGAVDPAEQLDFARQADDLGIAAYWVRDVPLNGPWYPESFGHLDPFVALAAAATTTQRIALGTAATVLTLRHPLHIAKAAASLQILSGSRLMLGLGAGDRPEEFAAFGEEHSERSRRYREHWEMLAAVLRDPKVIGSDRIQYELRPSTFDRPPMIAVGSGGQTLEWIARNARGWFTYHREPEQQRDRHALWRRAVDRWSPEEFRAFAVAMRLEIATPHVFEPGQLGYRTGRDGLEHIFEQQRDLGVHHLLLNLQTAPRRRARPWR
ncbi:LLM class flavin-dependent oxidoreductase [Sphingomonas sanxanigenens]|nr:LLM class flavin-dependent oxidoreductase [Sphingomonas sanxanigenens]